MEWRHYVNISIYRTTLVGSRLVNNHASAWPLKRKYFALSLGHEAQCVELLHYAGFLIMPFRRWNVISLVATYCILANYMNGLLCYFTDGWKVTLDGKPVKNPDPGFLNPDFADLDSEFWTNFG